MLCARFGRHRWSKKNLADFIFTCYHSPITEFTQISYGLPTHHKQFKKNVKGRNVFVVYRSRLSASFSFVLSLLSFDVLTILWPGQRCRRPP
jgi:hypothetical protein